MPTWARWRISPPCTPKSTGSSPRIDLLVNNAGISDEVYFLDATPENFYRMTAVDWRGLYFCAQYAAKRMIEKKVPGLIINVTSNQAEGNWPR